MSGAGDAALTAESVRALVQGELVALTTRVDEQVAANAALELKNQEASAVIGSLRHKQKNCLRCMRRRRRKLPRPNRTARTGRTGEA